MGLETLVHPMVASGAWIVVVAILLVILTFVAYVVMGRMRRHRAAIVAPSADARSVEEPERCELCAR